MWILRMFNTWTEVRLWSLLPQRGGGRYTPLRFSYLIIMISSVLYGYRKSTAAPKDFIWRRAVIVRSCLPWCEHGEEVRLGDAGHESDVFFMNREGCGRILRLGTCIRRHRQKSRLHCPYSWVSQWGHPCISTVRVCGASCFWPLLSVKASTSFCRWWNDVNRLNDTSGRRSHNIAIQDIEESIVTMEKKTKSL